jgi:hypothetical protein
MEKKIKKKKRKEESDSVKYPTLLELINQYRDGTLPAGQLVFNYISENGVGRIHKDELYKEVVMCSVYSHQHEDRLIGARTRITEE